MQSHSLGSFLGGCFIGLLLGSIIVGGGMIYLLNTTGKVPFAEEILQNAIHERISEEQRAQSVSVAGTVRELANGHLTIDVSREGETTSRTFQIDDKTRFLSIEPGDPIREITLSSEDISIGDAVTVVAQDAIGSVPNQYLIKVVKF